MSLLNYKFLLLSYFKKIVSTGRTDRKNGLRRRKRRMIACHRWVCSWAWSPILELQTRGQLSHGQTDRHIRTDRWTVCNA